MTSLKQIDFKNKKALIRVDFNVPVDEGGTVTDDTRIVAALPTINYILDNGGTVILMSHFGRPKGSPSPKYSLEPVAKHLSTLLKRPVKFVSDCIGSEVASTCNALSKGDVLLLENLRFYPEEELGDVDFAKKLSELGDVYINDAFGTAHRAHASTSIIAQFFDSDSRAFGFLMGSEVESLQKALKNGEKPRLAIIGGAKVSSKIDVLSHLLQAVDGIIIGGGMAYTFIKANGGNVGKSLVEEDKINVARHLLEEAAKKGVNVYLPLDSVNSTTFSDSPPSSVSPIDAIPQDEMGLDIGPKSIALFTKTIEQSNTIIWNGPMGVFEFENYQVGTRSIGEAVARATDRGAFSLVGGGDSVAAINKFGLEDNVSYVSTGGGAMLEYLEGKILPGIAAMEG